MTSRFRDVRNREIRVGQTIAYPVRQYAEMWLVVGVVKALNLSPTRGVKVQPLNAEQRPRWIQNVDSAVIVEA